MLDVALPSKPEMVTVVPARTSMLGRIPNVIRFASPYVEVVSFATANRIPGMYFTLSTSGNTLQF